jgi:hypothetical protein
VRRLLYAAFVLGGSAFIVLGTAAALHGTPIAYRVHPPVQDPGPTLAEMQAACVAHGGAFWSGTEAGVTVARCRPFISIGVHPVTK